MKEKKTTDKKRKKRRDNRIVIKFSLHELALIYELMQDVRFFYEKKMSLEEKSDGVKANLNTALKILEKIEKRVLSRQEEEAKKDNKKKD